ncbi:MAG: hypothetical protein ACT4QA_12740 [Panacagrimonas sp.]
MTFLRPLFAPLLLVGSLFVTPFAMADDAPLEPSGTFCQENPQKCAELRAHRAAFCKANPQTCETVKERSEERREYCAENPKECEELREEAGERREKLKAYCDEHPKECEKKKQELRERYEGRRDSR